MIETVFGLAVLVQLLAPGYIYISFTSRFLVVQTESGSDETMLRYAVTSLCLLAVTWPVFAALGLDPIGTLIATDSATAFLAEIAAHPLRWFLQIVVAPVFIALCVSYAERQAWGSSLFTRLGLAPMPNRPSAITAAIFHHRDADAIIEVMLKDGTRVLGRLGPDSAVTADKGYPDIFMDAVYLPQPDGSWYEDEESSGMVVMGSEIRLIQFYLNPEIADAIDGIEDDEEMVTAADLLELPTTNKDA